MKENDLNVFEHGTFFSLGEHLSVSTPLGLLVAPHHSHLDYLLRKRERERKNNIFRPFSWISSSKAFCSWFSDSPTSRVLQVEGRLNKWLRTVWDSGNSARHYRNSNKRFCKEAVGWMQSLNLIEGCKFLKRIDLHAVNAQSWKEGEKRKFW